MEQKRADLKKLIKEIRSKISYGQEMIESSILVVANSLKSLFSFLCRINQNDLLEKAIMLKDVLLQRYLLIEQIFDNDMYYQITLGLRLDFAEMLKNNCKVVQHHYYSNCVHYPEKGSLRHLLFTLNARLKILSQLRKEMEKYDEKLLQEMGKILHDLSQKNLESCLERLLTITRVENKTLQVKIQRQQEKTKSREKQIAFMEKQYFLLVAQKLHSEKWLSQEEIQKKVSLFGIEGKKETKQQGRSGWTKWCCSKKTNSTMTDQNYKFVLKPEDFRQQVANFFEEYQD